MKKALIFSDSHGRLDNLLEVLKRQRDFEAVFHMGDIMEDADRLRRATPYPVYLVRGNCDYDGRLPVQIVTEFGGKRIGLCHGHRYLNYSGIDGLRYWALEQGVDIGEKKRTRPAVVRILDDRKITLTITEGRFHQVKRMLHAVENEVTYLKRIRMGAVLLDEGLPRGGYRKLTKEEVESLKYEKNTYGVREDREVQA